jgi:acylphosphatase
MKTYHYIVRGRVQGVAFRYYTQRTAHELGVTGTVKNLYNGDVEVYAQGAEEAIKKFEDFLNRGPISARVDRLIREVFESNNVFPDFGVAF